MSQLKIKFSGEIFFSLHSSIQKQGVYYIPGYFACKKIQYLEHLAVYVQTPLTWNNCDHFPISDILEKVKFLCVCTLCARTEGSHP